MTIANVQLPEGMTAEKFKEIITSYEAEREYERERRRTLRIALAANPERPTIGQRCNRAYLITRNRTKKLLSELDKYWDGEPYDPKALYFLDVSGGEVFLESREDDMPVLKEVLLQELLNKKTDLPSNVLERIIGIAFYDLKEYFPCWYPQSTWQTLSKENEEEA